MGEHMGGAESTVRAGEQWSGGLHEGNEKGGLMAAFWFEKNVLILATKICHR